MSVVFTIIVNYSNLAVPIRSFTWSKLSPGDPTLWHDTDRRRSTYGYFEFHHLLKPSRWFIFSHQHQLQPQVWFSIVLLRGWDVDKRSGQKWGRHDGCFSPAEWTLCAGRAGGASWRRAKLAIIIRHEQKLQPYLCDCTLSRFSRRPGKHKFYQPSIWSLS